MTTAGPNKSFLITDITAHAQKEMAACDFSKQKDWSNPSCDKCYLAWLHSIQSKDSWACTGNPGRAVCVSYVPPMLPDVQAQNQQAFRSFTNNCVDQGVLDDSFRTYDH